MKDFSLTDDQEKAIKAFETWLDNSSSGEPFILTGYAGTGKTFLSLVFLTLVEERKLCWTVAAPTHKAVGVVRNSLATRKLSPTFYPSTVHRLLRLKLVKKGNKEVCEQTSQTAKSLEQLKLVLIDEASMISSSLLEIILQSAHTYKTRLVFVGDSAQLPPVGEEKSPAFFIKNASSSELSQVVRHKGSVLRLASLLRDENFSCPPPPCFSGVVKDEFPVSSLNQEAWLELAKSSLYAASKNNDPDSARILCYTNRYLERLIPHARRAVHGTLAEEMSVLPGEVLISRRAVMRNSSKGNHSYEEEPGMLFGSNTEMIVKEVVPEMFDFQDFDLTEKCQVDVPIVEAYVAEVMVGSIEYSIRLLPDVGTSARTILDSFLNNLSLQAKQLNGKDSRMYWKLFFYIRDSFAHVSPASVLTVHRSQGSTFGKVFIASDVFWPKDLSLRRQLAYVAVSRASEGVWLLGNRQYALEQEDWNRKLSFIYK